jgi:hypothetical protein
MTRDQELRFNLVVLMVLGFVSAIFALVFSLDYVQFVSTWFIAGLTYCLGCLLFPLSRDGEM